MHRGPQIIWGITSAPKVELEIDAGVTFSFGRIHTEAWGGGGKGCTSPSTSDPSFVMKWQSTGISVS